VKISSSKEPNKPLAGSTFPWKKGTVMKICISQGEKDGHENMHFSEAGKSGLRFRNFEKYALSL
jgi:hypothetical protein